MQSRCMRPCGCCVLLPLRSSKFRYDILSPWNLNNTIRSVFVPLALLLLLYRLWNYPCRCIVTARSIERGLAARTRICLLTQARTTYRLSFCVVWILFTRCVVQNLFFSSSMRSGLVLLVVVVVPPIVTDRIFLSIFLCHVERSCSSSSYCLLLLLLWIVKLIFN